MGFLAPEMYVRGKPYCAKVDTWSLGCTLLAFYNCGRPFSGGEFYQLTCILQMDSGNEERIAEERAKLDRIVSEMLQKVLPDDHIDSVIALRGLIGMCLVCDPSQRPCVTDLLSTEQLRVLSQTSKEPLDDPPESYGLPDPPGTPDSADIVSALIRNLIERFDFNHTGCLDKWELDLVRDRLHRSLEEKDMRSLELMGCWLDFQRGCPDADLATPDDATGRTLLHAVAQSDRSDELLDLLEDYCEEANPGNSDIPFTPFLHARDRDGHTPLWLAAAEGTSPKLCVRLLELGANVEAIDNDGVSVLQKCLAPGYQKPGEKRVDVITALRAFGAQVPPGLHKEPRKLTMQMFEAACISMEDARKTISKLQHGLNEMRQQRRLEQLSKSVPILPLMRPFSNHETPAFEMDNLSTPLQPYIESDAIGFDIEPLGSNATQHIMESPPISGRSQGASSSKASPTKTVSAVPAVLEKSSWTSASGELPDLSPVIPSRAASRDATSAQRSIGSRSGQRPPPMPNRRSIDRATEASPVVPRSLFQNRSRPSPGASPSHSPSSGRGRSMDIQEIDEEPNIIPATDVENQLRRHLLKLGKNHIQSAFRYADKDGDNLVGLEDIRHLLDTLDLSEGEEAKMCLKYFGLGRGLGMKAFSSWLRAKVNVSDTCVEHDQSMRHTMRQTRSSSQRITGNAWRKTNSSHGHRARSTDGFPCKAAPMHAVDPGMADESMIEYRPVTQQSSLAQSGERMPGDSLEPVVRRLSVPQEYSSVSRLPSLKEHERSRSPACHVKSTSAGGRCHSNRSTYSSTGGRTGHRSISASSLQRTSLSNKSHTPGSS